MQTHFTRETWRPGKRKGERKRHWGGQTSAPPGLIAAGVAGRFGSGAHRQCTATSRRTGVRCRAVAMVGVACCAHHGGPMLQIVAKRRAQAQAKREKSDP